MNNIEKDILHLIDYFKNKLNESISTYVIEMVSAGEYGVALEELCNMIFEYNIKITKKQYDKIKELAEEMKMDESIYIFLKSLIED